MKILDKYEFLIPPGCIVDGEDFHSYFSQHLADADTDKNRCMRRIPAEKRGRRIIATEGVRRTCLYSNGDRCTFFYGFDVNTKKSYCSAHKDEDVCVPLPTTTA